MTLEKFRAENPLLRSKMIFAREVFEATNPGDAASLGLGPTFEELLELADLYVETRVRAIGDSRREDIGIYHWSLKALDILETAIREAPIGTAAMPILGTPEFLDTEHLRRFQWTGIVYEGKKCHTTGVPCHTDLERKFAAFLDSAKDVMRYVKNERFGFSITYYEHNRPRQYFPDFIVVVREASGREVFWLAEPKGEIRHDTVLKRERAELWCQRMSGTIYGAWRYLFLPQGKLDRAMEAGVRTFAQLVGSLVVLAPRPQLRLIPFDHNQAPPEAYKTMLPLYTLRAAASYFGRSEKVEPEGWVPAEGFGTLNERMFVARVVGRSMEPRIYDGDYCVFRARPVGSRQGKIVLAQYRGPADPETGGAYTVKRYASEKVVDPHGTWRHTKITLSPLNSEFHPIVLTAESEDDVQVIAEWLGVLGRS